MISAPWQVEKGLKELKRFRREFDTEHLKVHTLKVFMDGTMKIHTAAMVTPYEDTHETGVTAFNKEQFAELLLQLNEEGLDVHLHTVGEAASRVVLDGVELARKALGDRYRVKVTCAHLEFQNDADLCRFAKLGVTANYTPWWHCGEPGEPLKQLIPLLGEYRATHMFRCKTVWDTGALVTWSCDNIVFGDFSKWNPFLGMEVGMTRWISEKTNLDEFQRTLSPLPPASEQMGVEEMILGYTINGAKQLGIESVKGSIEAGKDADFLVFDTICSRRSIRASASMSPGTCISAGRSSGDGVLRAALAGAGRPSPRTAAIRKRLCSRSLRDQSCLKSKPDGSSDTERIMLRVLSNQVL